QRQHYKILGSHGGVKLCHWLKKSLKGEGVCYKELFYGIKSHRCLQFTPTVDHCNHRCVYCWRNTEYTNCAPMASFDEPEFLVSEAERMQKMLLTGFGGILGRIDERKWLEAHHPNQAAISLAGEPLYYPKMSGLLQEFHDRGYTTFLVSNGTRSDMIEGLDVLPTQFYISLDAPTHEIYKKVCRPLVDGWSGLKRSLELMGGMECRTVNRLTLVRDWNIMDAKGYADLISLAEPDFVEVKAFMLVGGSRNRLTLDNMPTHEEVREFSSELSDILGYKFGGEKVDSRVVLLRK
ncbi:MAG TPA: 4-demethylwyosine synthase TYW1, partial [Candidatus Altiarchaeales archaeon]|nr:4-demethylwyosine synthase TYW1 [Candidatus Altiarchaeales archaeon]